MHALKYFVILFLFVSTSFGATIPRGEMLLRSADLGIEHGTRIEIDGKLVGIAPCAISLKTNIRHKFELKSSEGKVRTYFLTVRNLIKSDEFNNVPGWFIDPASLRSDFKEYGNLTPTTAASATIADAVSQAEAKIKARVTGMSVNRYNTVMEPAGKRMLDSSKSKYYPKLTRGQMDSLNDVNGGIMVTQSLGTSDRIEFLEYEIQRVGDKYQAYVLAGFKN
jgi:hypothetical protein